MTEFVLTYIPAWFIFALAILTAIHRWYIVWRYKLTVMSRAENFIVAIELSLIALFYAGRTFDLWPLLTAIAISRFVWLWVLVVSLFNSHKMAKRANINGLG